MTFAPLFGPFRFTARSFCQRLMIWQCDQQGRHRQARGLLREAARGGRRAHRGLLDDEHRPDRLRQSGLLMVPCVRRQTDRQTGRQTPTNNCCGPTESSPCNLRRLRRSRRAAAAQHTVQYAPCTATHSTCGQLYGWIRLGAYVSTVCRRRTSTALRHCCACVLWSSPRWALGFRSSAEPTTVHHSVLHRRSALVLRVRLCSRC